MNKRILRYAKPEVVFRTGSFYYPIIVNRNYFFVICPRKETKVVFSRGVFFICNLTCLRNYFYLSNGWVGDNGFYQFHYYYIPRVSYGLRDRTDGPKNPTLAL